jgi:hypothetical protein
MVTIYGGICCGKNNQKYSYVEGFYSLIYYWHYMFGIFMEIPFLIYLLVYGYFIHRLFK